MMQKTYLLTPLFALIAAAISYSQDSATTNAPIPLPHEDSDIPTDSAVTWGLLDNGLRYAILPNEEPPNRVSMRLFVDAGSLMEAEDRKSVV